VCIVILRNGRGVRRHARLATEVGASWEEIVAVVVLTQPGFGILPAVEALPDARRGHEEGLAARSAELEGDGDADG
jgi:hypothetical protein